MKALLTTSRVIVGLLFIFSGFVKAVDPLGFSYKLDEYFVVFGEYFFSGLARLSAISLPLSMLICALEILLGVAVLLGVQMKQFSKLLLAMILFFVGLTGFTVITGEVKDCGCFGEALSLTPLQTFIKDIILLAFIFTIFLYRKQIKPFFSFKKAQMLTWGAGLATLLLSLYCFYYIPIIDFRPYAIGNNIPQLMNDGVAPEYKSTLVYKNKNTGKTKEFTTSEVSQLDQSVWEWKETKNKLVKEGKPNTIQDLAITDFEGNEVTNMLLTHPSPVMLVVTYNIDKTTEDAFKTINRLKKKCSDIKFVGLTASGYKQADLFRKSHDIFYDFYQADATVLKTIVRSNPGLLLLKKGTVLGKWPNTDIPSCKVLKEKIKNVSQQ